jgi:hypothetical protein
MTASTCAIIVRRLRDCWLGADAQFILGALGRNAECRIRLRHQVGKPFADHALAETDGVECAHQDDPGFTTFVAQVRQNGVLPQVAHFGRNARQNHYSTASILNNEGGSGAARIFDNARALRNIRLPTVALRHWPTEGAETRFDLIEQVLMEHQRSLQGARHCLAGDIIDRWTKPAVQMTRSARLRASSMAAAMRSSLSPTTDLRNRSMPVDASCRAR